MNLKQQSSSVILLFIDGIGIGEETEHNPFYVLKDEAAPLAFFKNELGEAGSVVEIASSGIAISTDATLGIEGRPQSASGQTTILTGHNAPQLLGFHKQGFPNARMRELIARYSIFLQLNQRGIAPNTFINAYPPGFFIKRPRWVSATTVAVEAARERSRTFEDLRNEQALIHDFTNRALQNSYPDIPLHTPEHAAKILTRIARPHRFTLFEYFLTDHAGHRQDTELATTVLGELARFVRAVINNVDFTDTTLIITSDHGNLEDLSTRTHTRNCVPTLVFGTGQDLARRRIKDLAHITPTIIELLQKP